MLYIYNCIHVHAAYLMYLHIWRILANLQKHYIHTYIHIHIHIHIHVHIYIYMGIWVASKQSMRVEKQNSASEGLGPFRANFESST